MNHASVFSGIGGFDLAAEWAGYKNLFHCELNTFGQLILKYYWPHSKLYDNIETADFRPYRNKVDALSGGFPCQDNSKANQSISRKSGLSGARTGLAFHMLRGMSEIGPKVGVFENVGDFLTVNEGKDFRTILGELAGMGYNAEWRICRSSDVGAPHERKRLYIVAYSDSLRLQKGQTFFSYVHETSSQITWVPTGTPVQTFRGGAWSSEPPFPCVDDGLSLAMAGFTASQWRKEQIKAYGNAVSPQIPYAIFKAINELIPNN
jgi:DNA (cytosine-5)-methyltransferase 1